MGQALLKDSGISLFLLPLFYKFSNKPKGRNYLNKKTFKQKTKKNPQYQLTKSKTPFLYQKGGFTRGLSGDPPLFFPGVSPKGGAKKREPPGEKTRGGHQKNLYISKKKGAGQPIPSKKGAHFCGEPPAGAGG